LQVPIDIGLRREIERAAREQDTSLSQVMRTALREWQTRRQIAPWSIAMLRPSSGKRRFASSILPPLFIGQFETRRAVRAR
jgi:hypothetical protein